MPGLAGMGAQRSELAIEHVGDVDQWSFSACAISHVSRDRPRLEPLVASSSGCANGLRASG